MNKKETAKVMAIIFEAYHFFYKDSTPEKAEVAVNLWHQMFQVEPYEVVEAAVYSHIVNSTQPPTVAHIKNEIGKLKNPNSMTETDAVNRILKAASNSSYNAKEEFDNLPDSLKKIVGNPGQLKSWGMMKSSEMHTIIASQIRKSYRIIEQREKEMAAMPEKVRLVINQLLIEG